MTYEHQEFQKKKTPQEKLISRKKNPQDNPLEWVA